MFLSSTCFKAVKSRLMQIEKNLARQIHKQKRENLTAPLCTSVLEEYLSFCCEAHWAQMNTESDSCVWEWVSAECPSLVLLREWEQLKDILLCFIFYTMHLHCGSGRKQQLQPSSVLSFCLSLWLTLAFTESKSAGVLCGRLTALQLQKGHQNVAPEDGRGAEACRW